MTVTVSGSSVTYNDGSSDTSNTFGMTASASSGGVGTYGCLRQNTGSTYTNGSTIAGSSLQWTDCGDWSSGVYTSGTWRAMGQNRTGYGGFWLRIS